jgi:hypothetical protein
MSELDEVTGRMGNEIMSLIGTTRNLSLDYQKLIDILAKLSQPSQAEPTAAGSQTKGADGHEGQSNPDGQGQRRQREAGIRQRMEPKRNNKRRHGEVAGLITSTLEAQPSTT